MGAKSLSVILIVTALVILAIFFIFSNSNNSDSNSKGSDDPVALAKIIWDCYHIQDSNCLKLYATQELLSECAEAGDEGCLSTQKNIASYLKISGQFDYSEDDLRFELDSQNESDAVVFVYTPLSGEHFPNELYFRKVEDLWLYRGVELS